MAWTDGSPRYDGISSQSRLLYTQSPRLFSNAKNTINLYHLFSFLPRFAWAFFREEHIEILPPVAYPGFSQDWGNHYWNLVEGWAVLGNFQADWAVIFLVNTAKNLPKNQIESGSVFIENRLKWDCFNRFLVILCYFDPKPILPLLKVSDRFLKVD